MKKNLRKTSKAGPKGATSPAIGIKKSPVESNILLTKSVENLIDFWCDKNSRTTLKS